MRDPQDFNSRTLISGLVGFVTLDDLGFTVETTTLDYTSEVSPPRQQIRTTTDTTLALTEEQYWLGLGGSLANLDQRIGKRVFGWNDGGSGTESFAYDELGNRVSDGSGNTFVYNIERNRLLSATLAISGQTLAYDYDEAGFVTSRGGLPITWTALGRMASHGTDLLEWDMQGRLISATVSGIETHTGWFGGRVTGDPSASTLGGIDFGEVYFSLGSGGRQFRHLDFRGNVRLTSDEAGQITSQYRYSPYGVDAVFGSSLDSGSFVGRSEFGELMVVGERIYDPAIGRFLSLDPVYQYVNQYVYTLGNPVAYSDPDGRNSAETKAPKGGGKGWKGKVIDFIKDRVKVEVGEREIIITITICGVGAAQALPIVGFWWWWKQRRRGGAYRRLRPKSVIA